MHNLTGTTLGKHDVGRVLGEGSMGMVYLAHDSLIGRNVTIKATHPEVLEEQACASRYRKLFFNEAKVAGMLRHPNIVSVYDACIDEHIWYIVMEYVQGGRTLHIHCSPERGCRSRMPSASFSNVHERSISPIARALCTATARAAQ